LVDRCYHHAEHMAHFWGHARLLLTPLHPPLCYPPPNPPTPPPFFPPFTFPFPPIALVCNIDAGRRRLVRSWQLKDGKLGLFQVYTGLVPTRRSIPRRAL